MLLPLLLASLQATAAPEPQRTRPALVAPKPAEPGAAKPISLEARYDQCVDLATSAPDKGEADATMWLRGNGGYFARQCLGIALANQGRWPAAAQEFESAADQAEVAHDKRAANYWAQAGNAWLAANNPVKARSALDAALASGTLDGLAHGEALFDRARAQVAADNLPGARTDIDAALALARGDPMIWLASAALARRMNDMDRARTDVTEAYNRASDDPAVLLEIGTIAAMGGDAEGARTAWQEAIDLAPKSPAAERAEALLKQLDQPATPPASPPAAPKPADPPR